MRAVIQRVVEASVAINGKTSENIGHGEVILLGVGKDDTEADVDKLVSKIIKLRIFEDENGKINKNIDDVCGAMLIVSQFTLYWNCKKGNRPSFENAMPPQDAEKLYDLFVKKIKETGIPYLTGEFGADMRVSLINDGPVTVWLDTKENI